MSFHLTAPFEETKLPYASSTFLTHFTMSHASMVTQILSGKPGIVKKVLSLPDTSNEHPSQLHMLTFDACPSKVTV